jgi:hypothetical protein
VKLWRRLCPELSDGWDDCWWAENGHCERPGGPLLCWVRSWLANVCLAWAQRLSDWSEAVRDWAEALEHDEGPDDGREAPDPWGAWS